MAREDSVAITKADAVAHCRQAEEYLRAAEHSLEIADYNAAAGTAIDAGINAADAVAGINLGRRWKGPHEQAAQFVAGAGVDGRDIAKALASMGQHAISCLNWGDARPALLATPSKADSQAEYGGSIPLIRSRRSPS
jgi:hypothetical protein